MKILLISNYFAPDSGAAAIRLTRLAEQLHQRGHAVTVLTSLPHYPQGEIHPNYQGKFTVVENRSGMWVIQTWLWATSNPRISRKLLSQLSFMVTAFLRGLLIAKPDVILIEAQPVFTSLAGVLLAFLKRRPYVLNISDLWPDHLLTVGVLTEQHLIYRVARRIVDFTYRHANQIVAMSPRWAEIMQGYIGQTDKISVIYNGVDLDVFRPDVLTDNFREKYQLGNRKLITFIGTFATHYDFELIMDIAAYFNSNEDVRVVILGKGSLSDVVERRLKQPELSNAIWLDWIDREEIPAVWSASHVNFWAIRDEELYQGVIPAKLYEAIACGTPVAAAMEGVGAEVVTASGIGITVKCDDKNGLIEAIQKLLDEATFHAECRQAGRQYAETHFDHRLVAERYEQVLLTAHQNGR